MAVVRIKKTSFVDEVYHNKMLITKAGASIDDDEKKNLLKKYDCLEEVVEEVKKAKK